MDGVQNQKFKIAIMFLGLSTVEALLCVWFKWQLPLNTIEAQAGVAMAMIAGNATVSWAYAKSETRAVTDQTTRAITERRTAAGDGTEETP